MKLLLVNGSSRANGNTNRALEEVAASIRDAGHEAEIFQIGTKAVHGCIACRRCAELGKCVFDDDLCNELAAKAKEADGFVFGTPVYYAQPNGALLALLQRAAFSGGAAFRGKPAASVAVCRRGGASTAFQTLNLFYGILGMPTAPSQYWNLVYGLNPGDAELDTEGMQTMRYLGKNLVWMISGLSGNAPEREPWQGMNFIR